MNANQRTIYLLNKYGVGAQKRFSQNFLIDDKSIKTIVNSIPYADLDEVVEIGPGLGSLTVEIVKKAKHLTAIEFDNDMVKVLKGEIVSSNFTLIQNDFLKQDLTVFNNQKVGYIGNLPYQITRELIKKIVSSGHFSFFGFMVQKELADDLFYKVNNPSNNNYSAFLSIVGNLERTLDLLPRYFSPAPKVYSTFLTLKPTDLRYANLETFKILSIIFNNTKKNLYNNLRNSILKDKLKVFDDLKLDRTIRAHQLSINQLKELVDYLK